MDPSKDAYGQEVWAYFRGKKDPKESFEVVEREDGFVGLSGGAPIYFSEFKDWPAIQKKAVTLAKGRVLDIGAGAGRVSLYLQKKGFPVTSIDNSPFAVKVCKGRGLQHAMVLPIEGIGRFKPSSFDSVMMIGNNFGLFSNFKKAKRLLRVLHRITSPNGIIIAETLDPYKTDDPVHLAYHKLNRRRGRMSGQIRIRIRYRSFKGDWFDYLMVSKKELKAIVQGTGWSIRKFFDSKNVMYIAVLEKV